MEILINTFEPQKIIEILSSTFKVKPQSTGAELSIEIPKKIGEGSIKGIDFLDGVGLLRFDCIFNKDILINFDGGKKQPIRFIFCAEGELIHILDPDNFRYKLTHMVGAIASSSNSNNQIFMFPPRKRLVYHTLDINKEKFYPKIKKYLNTIPEKLANLFKDLDSQEHFLYQANYSLNIAECLHDIETNDHEGMVRRIFLESKALDLLWMQIKQYKDDQNPISKQRIVRKNDIDLIQRAKSILLEDLKNPPEIKKLAELTGTNQNKLKRGFKRLFDKSIGDVLRDERMNRAKLLLAEENLSIKEIAETVGYSNKSAFSKRFKNKFGMVPSAFLRRYKE